MNKVLKYSGIILAVLAVLFLFLPYFSVEGDPKEYSSLPIRAQVIDKETNEPLAKVIVVAYWLLYGGLEGGNEEGAIQLLEVETDDNGEFYFPAWGPIKVSEHVSSNARLRGESPGLIIFKSSYKPLFLQNEYLRNADTPTVRFSDWNGKKILLYKMEVDTEAYAYDIDGLNSDLMSLLSFSRSNPELLKCPWQRAPKILLALKHEEENIDGLVGSSIVSYFYSNEKNYINPGCISFTEFFQEHENE